MTITCAIIDDEPLALDLLESYVRRTPNAENPNDEENIFVRSEHHLIGIKLSDIQYLESLKDYVLIHIQGRTKPVYTLASLSSMEKSLPKNRFMRVHRSYIIPLQKITMLENDCVIVANKHIPVSKLYRTALQDYIANRTL